MATALLTKSVESYWESIILFMQEGALNPAAFSTWIQPLKPHIIDKDVFVLLAKDEYIKSTVNTRYAGKIASAFRSVFGKDFGIRVILESEATTFNIDSEDEVKPNLSGTNLRAKFHFDAFVRGKNNEFAYSAALAVADKPGLNYNPLFIYGGVGLGKTHLMHSIGNQILHNNPNAKVLYTSSENLVNEFVYAIRNKKNQEFRDKYRQVDCLLVDDIQFLSDKEGTQEEFFHTFNTLHNDNKQIVLTADKPPLDLQSIEGRLRSRFASDLIVDISLPDLETRAAILLKKAEEEGVEVDMAVVNFIAKYMDDNIRELEGALKTVTARAKLMNTKCTVELAEKALENMIRQRGRREVDVSYIQEVVSGYYNIPLEEMLSRKRSAEIIYARHVAMYLCRMIIDAPLKQIGKDFGGKDHSTIIHAVDKITANIDKNKTLKREVAELEKKIKIS
ncbi:MAG: chromosomal replication initiator protein DnaA [Defluviitaleaceae bacterium]|nr:chromosomal replication initiator protein DnaA [Defluviitaleaceae bacterium]